MQTKNSQGDEGERRVGTRNDAWRGDMKDEQDCHNKQSEKPGRENVPKFHRASLSWGSSPQSAEAGAPLGEDGPGQPPRIYLFPCPSMSASGNWRITRGL